MKIERLRYLHQQYLANKLSVEELDELKHSLSSVEFELLVEGKWNEIDASGHTIEKDHAERVYNFIINQPQAQTSLKLMPRWVAAACIAMIISIGGYFYYTTNFSQNTQLAYQNDVAPGQNGATLTLANGQKILINEATVGNIAEQSGVKISKTADGQLVYVISSEQSDEKSQSVGTNFNTLSTTRGQQTQVRLPDGTLVFLNAESSLRYPASFAKAATREVMLTGEGYFEVAKDKQHPFIVKTARQEVEVLGTQFNINSYSTEANVKTTLIEGSVKVAAMGKTKILKPNQQSVLASSGELFVNEADVMMAIAWKNNQFMFESESIQAVMRMVERWYDVKVEYVGEITTEKFGGGLSKFDKVSKVLKSLESTGKVHFRIEGKTIYVSK